MENTIIVGIAAVIGMFGWRLVRFYMVRKQVPELIKKGAIVLDVRNPEEYAGGHCKGSLNIPLPELDGRIGELDSSKTVIVCCVSGGRASTAEGILRKHGFREVLNAGPWQNTVC